MAGKLYLCATPIGNLEDITLRALRVLKETDLIAAEDTRNSMRLLQHFRIHTPLTSYHEYNKIQKAHYLIERMKAGEDVALITDAGTPCISDPGEELVRMCYEQGLQVNVLPGACACVAALTLSGLPAGRFCFEAFLPSDKKARQRVLEELKKETRTIVIYEAPHRLVRTLELLRENLGERDITLCRELTKKYETAYRTCFSEAISRYSANGVKGECVIVIRGLDYRELVKERQAAWGGMTIQEHMAYYEDQGLERAAAMKQVAKDRGVGKRDVYKTLLSS